MPDPNVSRYFSFDHPETVIDYVRNLDMLPDTGTFDLEKPGEGNMNFVARIRSGTESIVLKQSRPWVEKYPSIEAPVDRICTEVRFYRSIATHASLQHRMPRLLHHDADRFVAVFEDIGEGSDYTGLYGTLHGKPADDSLHVVKDIRVLLRWLSRLHGVGSVAGSIASADSGSDTAHEKILNREMRALNHAHMFEIPLAPENGIDLEAITPGLERVAARLRVDSAYGRAVAELGNLYLSDGASLLHGDFYPGSWVRSKRGPMVIDPEFAFHGPAEFDVGVCRAHLLLSGMPLNVVDDLFLTSYDGQDTDASLVRGFTGVEIMRRLLGVAQLPLERTAEEKERLLSHSRELVLGGGL